MSDTALTPKAQLLELIQAMPDDASPADLHEILRVVDRLIVGISEGQQGKSISSQESRQRFEAWRSKYESPTAHNESSMKSAIT